MLRLLLSAAACLSLFAYSFLLSSIGPLVKPISHSWNADLTPIFTTISAGFIITVLVMTFSNRWSLRQFSLLGQALFTAGCLLFALSTDVTAGTAAYGLAGLGAGLVQVSSNTIVAALYPERRTMALSILHVFFGLGGVCGPAAAASFAQNWPLNYMLLAALSGLIFFMYLAVPAGMYSRDEGPQRKPAAGLWRDGFLVLLGLYSLCYLGVEIAVTSWIPAFLEEGSAWPAARAAAAVSLFWITVTAGRFLAGALSRKISTPALFAGHTVMSITAFSLLLYAPSEGLAWAAVALAGLAFSGLFPLIVALAADHRPDEMKYVTGLIMTWMGAGFLIMPALVGFIRESAGIKSAMQVLLLPQAGQLLLAAAVVWYWRRHSAAGRSHRPTH